MNYILLALLNFLIIPWWLAVLSALIRRNGEKLILFYLEEKKKMILQMGEEAVVGAGKLSFRN